MWRWRGGGELTETIHIIADYQLPALTLVHCADAQRIDLCNAVPTDLSMGGLGRVGWEGWRNGGDRRAGTISADVLYAKIHLVCILVLQITAEC